MKGKSKKAIKKLYEYLSGPARSLGFNQKETYDWAANMTANIYYLDLIHTLAKLYDIDLDSMDEHTYQHHIELIDSNIKKYIKNYLLTILSEEERQQAFIQIDAVNKFDMTINEFCTLNPKVQSYSTKAILSLIDNHKTMIEAAIHFMEIKQEYE